MMIDIAMGTLISIFGRRDHYDSRKWVNGFIRKIGYLAIVLAVDLISSAVMKDGNVLCDAITIGFIFYEFSSIIENVVRAGGKLPKSVQKFIDKLAAASGEKEESNDPKKSPPI